MTTNKKKVEFTIDFKEINKFIKFVENRKTIFYDPFKRLYFIDGVEITDVFLNEVVSKFAHVVNTVSNMKLDAELGSVDAYRESLNFPSNKRGIDKVIDKDMIENEPKKGNLLGEDGKVETYD